MKKITILILTLAATLALHAQVAINTTGAVPDNSAMLDVQSTTTGMLVPRMTTAQRNLISSPANGLLVYDTTTQSFWFYQNSIWTELRSGNITALSDADGDTKVVVDNGTDGDTIKFYSGDGTLETFRIIGNRLEAVNSNVFIGINSGFSDTSSYSNVAIGTNALHSNTIRSNLVAIGDSALYHNGEGTMSTWDKATANTAVGSKALYSNTTGYNNTALGFLALSYNTTGSENTALGYEALSSNSTGSFNTAIGRTALNNNDIGSCNTALGIQSLCSNVKGNDNTASGYNSLFSDSTGSNNAAFGSHALFSDLTGNNNAALGPYALYSNSSGNNNTASGYHALHSNTTGYSNVAIGTNALHSNTIRSNLVAIGDSALYNNIGEQNTALGSKTLFSNTSGYENTASGYHALYSNTGGYDNTAFGMDALYSLATGRWNTSVGHNAYYNGNYDNSTAIGDAAAITASNQIRLGDVGVGSIGGFANWTNVSDKRFKENVKNDVPGLSFIKLLRPVTYNLNINSINRFLGIDNSEKSAWVTKSERSKIRTTGFIAQEVEQAAQSIGYNFSGVDKPKNENDYYGLRYAEFVVPLVKAVQEQQIIIEKQQVLIDALKADVEKLKIEIENQR